METVFPSTGNKRHSGKCKALFGIVQTWNYNSMKRSNMKENPLLYA